MGEQINTYITN